MDYERSNFSVNPCIFAENAQQNIFPIIAVNASNEYSTNTSNGMSSQTHRGHPDQTLSSAAVVGITVFAVLGVLILSACVTLSIFGIRRRIRLLRHNLKHESCRNEHRVAEYQAKSGFAPNTLSRTTCELGSCDIEKSEHEAEGMKHNPFSLDPRQYPDQYPVSMSTCRVPSEMPSEMDKSLTSSSSSLRSKHVRETAHDSDHNVTSPHSTPTNIIESETDKKPSFDVLEAGHWTLEIWPSIAENIRTRYRDIMGIGNMGSINLLAYSSVESPASGSPAVCISCKYPDRVNRSVLQEILGPLKDLPIIVRPGSIRRSGCEEEDCFCTPKEKCLPCQGKILASAFEFGPAAYGRYMQRPDCGASIGVNDSGLDRARVSLGGYISLKIGDRWILNAVTCHHLIEESDVETLGIQSRADGTSNTSTTGVKYSIQSSAKVDYEGEVKRLSQRIQNDEKSPRKFEKSNIGDAYESLVKAELRFGEARCSSGISIDADENLQVYTFLDIGWAYC